MARALLNRNAEEAPGFVWFDLINERPQKFITNINSRELRFLIAIIAYTILPLLTTPDFLTLVDLLLKTLSLCP
jgi:hypothetical protein